VSDHYTIHQADDGAARIRKNGQPWSQSAFTPKDPFDELVLQAVVEGLNGRHFQLTGTALDVAKKCGMPVAQLALHVGISGFRLLMRMMREQGQT
jgi:hypothetical protein